NRAIPVVEANGLPRHGNDPAGLTNAEARRRLAGFGPNAVADAAPSASGSELRPWNWCRAMRSGCRSGHCSPPMRLSYRDR
ncbi:MAG: hypothetical protein HYU75_13335, partial [Betaproteobacteria bacterium]|nr:hypothetical protein [Betaproteobacteria bacterium]